MNPRNLRDNLAVALVYALLGWGALTLSVPPGYSLPIFPAAGLALAAVLAGGARLQPGVFLGALAVQLIVSRHVGLTAMPWSSLTIVPFAAVLQAAAGACLLRRLIGYPTPLDSPREIIRFASVVAPIGCLVGASIAVPTLGASQVLESGKLLGHWLTWWLGDTIGVLIALPVALSLFGRPAEDWRPRRLSLVIPQLIGFGLLTATLWHLRSSDLLQSRTEFTRQATALAHQLETRLTTQVEMLRSAQRLVTVSQFVDRREWHDFVTPWFLHYPGMLNFTWNPLVAADHREAFEASVRAEGYPDFHILDRLPGGGTVPARETPDGFYLPITYLEPYAANAAVFGLNPLSIPNTGEAIRATLSTGQPRASGPFRLTQESADQVGVVLYQGVRKPIGGRIETIGIVSSALRMGNLLDAALVGHELNGIMLCLMDVGGPAARRLAGSPECERSDALPGALGSRVPIEFAGRNWELRISATPAFESGAGSGGARATMLAGLASVATLGGFLLLTTGRTRRIQELVDQRTAELAAASRRLLEQQGALAEAQRIAGLGSWHLMPGSEVVSCSEECHRILGLPPDRPVHLDTLVSAVDPAYQPQFHHALEQAREAVEYQAQTRRNLDCQVGERDGGTRIVHLLIEASRDSEGQADLRGTVQDVTASRNTEARIQRLADFDTLTGLPNRNYWLTHARSAVASARRHGDTLAVLFIDLDNFKTINDSLGHQVGDRMLTVVAERFGSVLREEDLLARLGGDEFVALLPRIGGVHEARAVAHKLLALRERPITVDGHELPLSMSIGIAAFPDDGTDVDTLLRHADMAMYGAKGAGRNTCQTFVPEMNTRAVERLQLDNALHRAIGEDQLFLVYQPQVDVRLGRTVGYEALLRWRHPELGLVSPDRFIPVAEVSGLIVPIGDWVMQHAFQQQRELKARGHSSTMAINISAIQFRRTDFVQRVKQALASTGVEPSDIELEITESALMDPTAELLQRLDDLRELGIRLALDDFGTGYSSLSYLKRLPIQALKLDRSFVSDLPGDPEDAAISSATLSMASDLGVEVVAEGVETDAQRRFLQLRGCRLMQGYLFSQPVPAEALPVSVDLAQNA